MSILRARLKEWVLFDSALLRLIVAVLQFIRARIDFARGRNLNGWRSLFRLHRSALNPIIDEWIESRITTGIGDGTLRQSLQEHIESTVPNSRSKTFFATPKNLFPLQAIVLKSATDRERGVLLLNYSYVYAPFAKLFDLQKIASRYAIVLEPSWSGSCDENMLSYGFLPSPTFVQTTEPRDIAFLKKQETGIIPVPTAGNWWVDHELYRPLPEVTKDADLVMVSAWGIFKRHERFFEALRKLRRRGRKLQTILVGYPSDRTLAEIEKMACYFGVRDQVEFHEWLEPEAVNRMMNRAKVNVLWSRREGFNRSVIEGLFAGLPFIMRDGFNYGDRLDYVNDKTGHYVKEHELPERILDMLDNLDRYQPRAWAMENMTYLQATAKLEQHIAQEFERRGEPWSGPLAHHVTLLHGNRYPTAGMQERFAADYEFLLTTLRQGQPASEGK